MPGAPTFAQELLVTRLREQWAFDMIRIQPNFATVLRSGGTGLVIVRPDGAPSETEQIIPVTAGVRWEAGQRIVTVPTQGGTPVAVGVVPTSAAGYAVVGTEHIIPSSITAALLANGAVSFSKLDVDTQGKITTAQTTASQAMSAAQSASSAASSAASTASSAATTANSAYTLASSASSAASAAQTTANSAASEAARAHTRISGLNFTIGQKTIDSTMLDDDAVLSRTITAGHVTKSKLSQNIRTTITQLCNKTGACQSWQDDHA